MAGLYEVGGLKAGSYRVHVSVFGWERREETLSLSPEEENVDLAIELSPALELTGTVKDDAQHEIG